MCLCAMERTDNPNKQRVVNLPHDLLSVGFEGVRQICTQFNFGEDKFQQVWSGVAKHLNLRMDGLNNDAASHDQQQGSAK